MLSVIVSVDDEITTMTKHYFIYKIFILSIFSRLIQSDSFEGFHFQDNLIGQERILSKTNNVKCLGPAKALMLGCLMLRSIRILLSCESSSRNANVRLSVCM